ncbi:MAG: glycosyltransferase [Actinomycetales bacterium]
MEISVVHDYFTQQGGAERVAVQLARHLGRDRVLTAFYEPRSTFRAVGELSVTTLPINHVSWLRHDPRRAFMLLAESFSRVRLNSDVVLCSSSGWAHGVSAAGHKVVYCHNPARWLYQPSQYLQQHSLPVRAALRACRAHLLRVDQKAAHSPRTTYIANSTNVARRIRTVYDLHADVVPPPVSIDPDGPREPIPGLEPGYLLTVGRARSYKYTEAVVEAMHDLPEHRLVTVGWDGQAPAQVADRLIRLRDLSDAQLRWVYANSQALVAVSDEDFGLTPIEQNAFGRPVVALAAGGYLDSVVEGLNGLLISDRRPATIAQGVRDCLREVTDRRAIRKHAARFSPESFCQRIAQYLTGIPTAR